MQEWVRVTREDGETVGWLEPLDAGYELLRPRDVLGHPAGPDAAWVEAEESVQECGLSHLAREWTLDGEPTRLALLEVSPRGIVVAPALQTKALVPAERTVVSWPDTAGRLRLA
ncbi:MAG: hypothetical protein LBE25_01525 [Arthrobacter sp.]|nr:hypothetical protein [Arthrobacter sp.]